MPSNKCLLMAASRILAAIFLLPLAETPVSAQALSVAPVNIVISPGQRATTLSVTNQGISETSIQIRAYAWSQKDNSDELTPTDMLVVSPPLATIAPGVNQVVRLLLRQPPQSQEATYRILVDQIPPATKTPGVVSMVLRMSIPVFAQPAGRAVPHLQFHLERNGDKLFLVGINDGHRHDVLRDVALTTGDGRKLNLASDVSPYILAGVTRRWSIAAEGPLPESSETLQLTAHADTGNIDQQVQWIAAP